MSRSLKEELKSLLISIVGITILGLSITLISWQFKLVTSGLPGYALILNYKTGVSVGTALFAANTIILLITLIVAGKSAGLKGFFGYGYLSLVVDLTKKTFNLHQVIIPSLQINIFLYVFQGLIAACAIGFIVYNKYSFGSYSSILPITDKYLKIHPPVLFFILDLILAVMTAYLFSFDKGILLLINAGAFFISFHYALKLLTRV